MLLHVWRSKGDTGVFLNHSPSCIWRQGLSLGLEQPIQLVWLLSLTLRLKAILKAAMATSFYVCSGDPKSSPQAYMASTLSVTLSPQLSSSSVQLARQICFVLEA